MSPPSRRHVQALIAIQKPAGYWVGELQGDSILESEYILLKFILGQESDPRPAARSPTTSAASSSPTAAGTCTPAAPADISGTVKGYFALKLMGDDPDAPHMTAARS